MEQQQKEQAYLKAKTRVKELKEFYNHAVTFVIINTLIGIAVWYYGGSMWFFLVFAVGGWAIGLIAHALKTFQWNPFLGADWEQRKINELMKNHESNY